MPYKITRSESYKADQIKLGSSLKHYGVKGMKWGKEIFGKDDIPGQSRSSSSGAPPSKALASVLSAKVRAGGSSSGYSNPVTRRDAQKTNMALRSNPGLPLARTPSPNKVQIAGGSSELVKKQTEEPKKDTRNGLQKWFDQAGKDIGNTFNSAKKGVEDAASSVKKWGEGAVNDTKKWVEGAANDTKKWTDNAIKDIGKTAVKIGDDAKKAYGDAEKWVNGAIKDVGKAAVKVGDDAKKAYGDAKKWVDTAIGDAKKWTDQAGKDIGKTASELADEVVYGTKYAVGTARTAVKNAANKVKDTYERITDTGTQRLLNPKHMTSRQKQAIWSKRATKQGVEKNLEEGLGPMVNSYDAFKAIDKKTGGKGYDVVARSGQTQRDLAKKNIKSNTPKPRELVNKKSPTVKFLGPSMADATKYLSPSDLSSYKRSLDYVKRYGRGDGSVERELNGYINKVEWEKSRERNK